MGPPQWEARQLRKPVGSPVCCLGPAEPCTLITVERACLCRQARAGLAPAAGLSSVYSSGPWDTKSVASTLPARRAPRPPMSDEERVVSPDQSSCCWCDILIAERLFIILDWKGLLLGLPRTSWLGLLH